MLLFIALANAVGVVGAQPPIESDPHGVGRWVDLFMVAVVHARTYPVFAIMFGYGLVQLAARLDRAGATPERVRSVLLRRNAWLVGFGLAHAVLLYFGDFLGAYGIVGIVATLALLRRGERVHRALLWLWGFMVLEVLVLAALVASHLLQGSNPPAPLPVAEIRSLAAPDYITSMFERIHEWPRHTLTVVPFIIIVWLGMWGARHRLLEEPATHRRLLRRIAAGALGIAVAGGLPLGLTSAGLLHADAATISLMILLHQASGMFGGPGYVALFGLAALHLSRGNPSRTIARFTRLVTALGQRSLSGYLLQSVAWLLLLAPYTLSLGERFGNPMLTAAAIATLVWLASLAGASLMHRHGHRGPAEALLRRLIYGDGPRSSQARTPDFELHS